VRPIVAAIRVSAPFEHLPESFKGPSIELRLVFSYNQPLSEKHPQSGNASGQTNQRRALIFPDHFHTQPYGKREEGSTGSSRSP
jgi:hypothetical protein